MISKLNTRQEEVRQPRPRPRSGLYLLPSVADVIFIVLLIAFSYGALAPRLLWDADIGWHIRDGENILATHSIPRTDSFSATKGGEPWYAWEWLYDLTVGWINKRTGLNGVVFISAVIIAATLALVFRISIQRGGSIPATAVLFVLCAMASSIHFLARPHVVGWLFAVIWYWILDSRSRSSDRSSRLLWLPIMMLFWANLHGGFVLGFVLLGIYIVAELLTALKCPDAKQRGWSRRRAAQLLAVGVLSFAASLLNPYGFRLHVHVYEYLTNRFLMQHISEFKRPDLHGAPAEAFLLMVALGAIGIIVVRGRLRWSSWLLLAFSIFSGLYAARNLPFASMLLMMITAPLLSGESSEKRRIFERLRRWRTIELAPRIPLWPALVVLSGAAICLNQGRLGEARIMDAHFDPSRLPVQAADFIQQTKPGQPLFSLDSWGGYFIYQLYPRNKVFVDDRHDFYGEAYIRDYLSILHVDAGWEELLNTWGGNLIIMPPDAKLSIALKKMSSWRVIHTDATTTIFERAR